jgi:hypothetical protein
MAGVLKDNALGEHPASMRQLAKLNVCDIWEAYWPADHTHFKNQYHISEKTR